MKTKEKQLKIDKKKLSNYSSLKLDKEKQLCSCVMKCDLCSDIKQHYHDGLSGEKKYCLPQSLKIDALQTIIKGIWISGFMNHSKGQQEGFEQIKFLFLSLIKQNAGQLRQWLNEDRITDPKKMVTTEQILHWLDIEGRG